MPGVFGNVLAVKNTVWDLSIGDGQRTKIGLKKDKLWGKLLNPHRMLDVKERL
jgi:hypothetical protein